MGFLRHQAREDVNSSNYDSQYGHPHDEVLEEFATRSIETYWTGVHGDIVVTTDGQSVAVATTSDFSTDPLDILEEKPRDDDAPSLATPGLQGLGVPVFG